MKILHFPQILIAATLLFVALAASVQAYGVTNKEMTRLSDTLTMYTLTYEFGFLNAELWVPIAASKTSGGASAPMISGNQATAIVLSTESIIKNRYYVPMGEKGSFTLLVLEQHAPGESQNSITVDELPLFIKRKGEEATKRIFKREELKDFYINKTP